MTNQSNPHNDQRSDGSGGHGADNTGDGGRLDLRALIASADPAASLIPVRADRLHRLKETTMTSASTRSSSTSSATDTPISGTSTTSGPRSGRRWVVAGVAGLAVAAAAAVAIPTLSGSDDPTTPPTAATSELSQPGADGAGAPAAMCAEVTPAAIAGSDLAFRADVTSIAGEQVTLTVLDRFAGEVGDTVTTTQGDESAVDGAALTFEEGATYLISASDGQIITCGVSGEQEPTLDGLYRTAFTR